MPIPGRKAKKPKKSKARQLAEYAGFSLAMLIVRLVPYPIAKAFCRLLGNAFFLVAKRRRTLAIENLRMAFGSEKSPAEIRAIAKQSIHSFLMTCFEMMWVTTRGWPEEIFQAHAEEIEKGLQRIRAIYDKAGGIIFVTPHLGNWEIFVHLSRLADVPLTIVARPLDNPLLERLVARTRTAAGQRIIHKKNAMFVMEEALRQGVSVGILADQSSRGIPAKFFGRPAFTTVIPAILAYKYGKPIVVVACVRENEPGRFRGMIGDAIWPNRDADEGAEIQRLTEEMNGWMESFIRTQPDQWLWMHDRWKRVSRPLQIG